MIGPLHIPLCNRFLDPYCFNGDRVKTAIYVVCMASRRGWHCDLIPPGDISELQPVALKAARHTVAMDTAGPVQDVEDVWTKCRRLSESHKDPYGV